MTSAGTTEPGSSTTIIGAGLCGLAIAYRLQQAGISTTVLEANDFAGGRIQPAGDHNSHQDLGPTWVWPYAQPVVSQWVNELGLNLFDQFDSGNGLFDRSANESATPHPLPSQHGIARITGGTHSLIKKLVSNVAVPVKYNHVVTDCTPQDGRWHLQIKHSTESESQVTSTQITDHLIFATPPRLTAAMLPPNITSLAEVRRTLEVAETWMAPHAKIVVFYNTAFWREAGLSGRVASQVGPLTEIHDHSGPDGTPAALFGFSGVPANIRAEAGEHFVEAIQQQLTRCFGNDAPAPNKIIVKDWAFEQWTTTEADRNGSGLHPPVLQETVRQPHCDNSLWFAGSETAATGAGLIEGALERADEVAQQLIKLSRA